jgi:hypothetical protein
MTKLFQNDKTGIMINVDLSKNLLEIRLLEWMREKHPEVFYNDIEMHEGGKVKINHWLENSEIQFSGDNGILIFDECAVDCV